MTEALTGPLVFIAGPYEGDHAGNVRRAVDVHVQLLDVGIPSICPHLSHFVDLLHERPYDAWLALALAQVERCDQVLRLTGPSPGADQEVRHAASLGKPVWFEEHGPLAHFIESILGATTPPLVRGPCPPASVMHDAFGPSWVGNRYKDGV